MKKRLLIVSWAMPPYVFPRSIQVARLCRGLSQRGWKLDVISAHPTNWSKGTYTTDERLRKYYRQAYHLYRVRLYSYSPGDKKDVIRFWLQRIPKKADDQWMRGALRICRWLRWRASALVTFAQPWTDHMIGLEMKHRFPFFPWVAHFSDPWIDSPFITPETVGSDTFERWRQAEYQVIEKADALVFVTRRSADLVMAKYSDKYRKKVFILPHVCELDHHVLDANYRDGKRLHIVHTGNLYSDRVPYALINALNVLRQADTSLHEKLAVHFIGFTEKKFIGAVDNAKLNDIVSFRPSVPFMDSIGYMLRADVLLVVDAPVSPGVFLPSKIMDYIAARKPILGLTPDNGETKDLLTELGCMCVPPDNARGIAEKLKVFLVAHADNKLSALIPDETILNRFSHHVAAKNMEKIVLHTINKMKT